MIDRDKLEQALLRSLQRPEVYDYCGHRVQITKIFGDDPLYINVVDAWGSSWAPPIHHWFEYRFMVTGEEDD